MQKDILNKFAMTRQSDHNTRFINLAWLICIFAVYSRVGFGLLNRTEVSAPLGFAQKREECFIYADSSVKHSHSSIKFIVFN